MAEFAHPAAPPANRTTLAIVGVVVVLVLWSLFNYRAAQRREIVREVRGTITSVDAAARRAAIAAMHPKTGEQMPPISGSVPENCDIRVNDAPARLADLREGDTVRVEGRIDADRNIRANWIRVTRPIAPASMPAEARG